MLTVAALVAATLTAIALDQTAKARRASGLAVARELAAAAVANLDVDHQLAILLALQALRTDQEVDDSIDPRVEEVLRRAAPAVSDRHEPDRGNGHREPPRSRPTEPRSRSSVVMDRSGYGIFGTAHGPWRSALLRSHAAPMLRVRGSSKLI